MSNLIDRAAIFAAQAHAGAKRKGTNIPYITHPMEAMAIAATMTEDEEVIAAAVLHDTVEDTPVTKEDIVREFGEEVAYLVSQESENKREDQSAEDTWKIRKQETIDHLTHCGDVRVKMIALADKLSNIRAMDRDKHAYGEWLWERFNQKDPALHAWYYSSFLESCKELADKEAYKEYARRIDVVFGEYRVR